MGDDRRWRVGVGVAAGQLPGRHQPLDVERRPRRVRDRELHAPAAAARAPGAVRGGRAAAWPGPAAAAAAAAAGGAGAAAAGSGRRGVVGGGGRVGLTAQDLTAVVVVMVCT